MNKFLWYIKSILWNSDSSNASHVKTTESTQQDLHTNISWVQDQFTFLYNNFADYRRDKNPPVNFTHATQLAQKYFVDTQQWQKDCVYRGMGLSIDAARNIYKSGMLLRDVADQDDPELCFTSSDPFFSQRTIQRAVQENPDHLSFIFEIPIHLLKKYGIKSWWWGDKFIVSGDIPPEIVQQCRVFVVDYKNDDLIPILPQHL